MKNVLTIAGSDSSGGAGIQADLKTMCALGCYGMSVVTAVTVQNTLKVFDVQEIRPDIVAGQIDAVYDDIPVDAVKIGMLSDIEIIKAVHERLIKHRAKNIVLDPVMVSKSGYSLLRPEAEKALAELLSAVDIVTPNIPEAELLTGTRIMCEADMKAAAAKILEAGAKSALIKGGHLSDSVATDILLTKESCQILEAPRVQTKNTHGTGCTLSSAIACGLADGLSIEAAVRRAKKYVTEAIQDSLNIGGGCGPLGHMRQLYRRAGVKV